MVLVTSRYLMMGALICLVTPALARSDDGGQMTAALTRCRAIATDASRLACYDQAAATIAEALRAGELVVTTRQEEETRRRASFGLPPTDRLTVEGPDGKTVEVDKSESVVRAISASGYDRYLLTLADNSAWQTMEGMKFGPEIGDKIEIRSAALGSYLATIGGQRAVRIKRVR